jgi:hypothetical protein
VTVRLKPKTERLVQEEIRRGHFHSVAEGLSEARGSVTGFLVDTNVLSEFARTGEPDR